MRKYILMLVAVVSAITLYATINTKKAANEAPAATYYWYKVTYDAAHPSGAILNSADLKFPSPQTPTYADANDNCEGTGLDCLRGFTAKPTSFPVTTMGEIRTEKAL